MQLKIKLILQVTNNKMAHSLWVISIFCILLFIGLAKAENEEDKKFELMVSDERVKHFALSNAELNFSTSSPKNFIWNEKNIVPPEFVDAAVFSSFKQEFVGYDPLNRDRFEIQIYSAKIFPTRVAMAAGYSSLLASQWGELNFGLITHTPEFGEVLGGDKSSGVTIVNRITTIRRGEHLVIIRSKFNADYYDKYKVAMDTFVGSVLFDKKLESDPIIEASKKITLGEGIIDIPFEFSMPQNWDLLPLTAPKNKLIQMWVDVDDPYRNSGAMVAVVKLNESKLKVKIDNIDEQEVINYSYDLCIVMMDNLFRGDKFTLKPFRKNSYNDLTDLNVFNMLGIFEAYVNDKPARVTILLSIGKNGIIIATAVIAGGSGTLYDGGTLNHGDYVQGIMLQHHIKHWKKLK